MSIFSKKIPKACPKCGKAEGWHCEPDSAEHSAAADIALREPIYLSNEADHYYHDPMPKVKYRWICDNCGFEKKYCGNIG